MLQARRRDALGLTLVDSSGSACPQWYYLGRPRGEGNNPWPSLHTAYGIGNYGSTPVGEGLRKDSQMSA